MSKLYPLTFEPNLSERPWGGDLLASRFHKPVPVGKQIGESWEIYTDNTVANGPYKGKTLRALLAELGPALGPRDAAHGDFPLLAKILDAGAWLSVQVHPDDQQAADLEGEPRGKTECWYVLDALPGATLAFGMARAMTADEFRAALTAGEAPSTMAYVPVQAGDFLYVRAGTMHALGPGILIYELQQSSDTTYRVYDWDRVGVDGKPRALHLEKALRVARLAPEPEPKVAYTEVADPTGNSVAALIRGPFFALDRVRLHTSESQFDTDGVPRLITVTKGAIRIDDVVIHAGYSTLLPAGLGVYQVQQSGNAEFLIGWPNQS